MNIKGDSTLKICLQKLNYLNYSDRTIENYISHIKRFLESQEKSCLHLNSKDFQSYLDNYEFNSVSQQNQIINSIRFLYKEVVRIVQLRMKKVVSNTNLTLPGKVIIGNVITV